MSIQPVNHSEAPPKVSVIMNCFNCEKYLREAIDSVYAQTFGDWEIIFWDNASTDKSAEIAKSYDKRLRYFMSEETVPLGRARNMAVEKARADWVAFLDCDDLWLPEKLEKQVEIIEEEKGNNLGLVYGRSIYFKQNGESGESAKNYNGKKLPEGSILENLLLEDNFIPILSTVILKEAYFSVGGIPPDYRQAEDYYIFVAISSKYRVRAVQSICCKYRIHSSNITLRQKTIGYQEVLRVVLAWLPFVDGPVQERLKKKRIREINSYMGAMMVLYDRNYFQGMKCILKEGSIWVILKHFLQKN